MKARAEKMNCRQCGRELPKVWGTDICLECSRENVRKIFKENPDIKEVFKETIEDLKKPENVKKMTDVTCAFMRGVQALQKSGE